MKDWLVQWWKEMTTVLIVLAFLTGVVASANSVAERREAWNIRLAECVKTKEFSIAECRIITRPDP